MPKLVELAIVMFFSAAVVLLVGRGCSDPVKKSEAHIDSTAAADSTSDSVATLKEIGQFMRDSSSDYGACVDELKDTVDKLKECVEMAHVFQLLLKHCAPKSCLEDLADRVAKAKKKESESAVPRRLETNQTRESKLQVP